MKRRDWTALALALMAGAFAAWVDMNATEVQATVLTLGVVGILLGFAQPQRWWLSGIVLGATIPLAYLVVAGFGVPLRFWPQPNVGASVLAILPAIAATAIGARAGGAEGSA